MLDFAVDQCYYSCRQVFHCLVRQTTPATGVRVTPVSVTTQMPFLELPGLDQLVEARLMTASRSSRCSHTLKPRSTCLMLTTAQLSRPCPRRVWPFRQCHPLPPTFLASPPAHPAWQTLSTRTYNTPHSGLQWVPSTATRRDTRATPHTPLASLIPRTATSTAG